MSRDKVVGLVVLIMCALAWLLILRAMEPTAPGPGDAPSPTPTSIPGPPVVVDR